MEQLFFLADIKEVEVQTRSANPLHRLDKSQVERVAFNLDILKERIYQVVSNLDHALPRDLGPDSPFQVDTATFTLTFDASGEVSILSTMKGAVGSQAGIQITIKRKGGGGA